MVPTRPIIKWFRVHMRLPSFGPLYVDVRADVKSDDEQLFQLAKNRVMQDNAVPVTSLKFVRADLIR